MGKIPQILKMVQQISSEWTK